MAIKAALNTPGASRFLAAAGLTRAAIGLIGISLVLLAEPGYGYAVAGKLAGVFVVSAAVSKLVLTSWADRRGQGVVLALSVPLQAAALGAIVFAALFGASVWVLFVLAVVGGGFEAPAGAFSRARWLHALDDPILVRTAFSLESVVDEVIFVVGPVVATTLAAAYGGAAGLVLSSVLVASGGLWLWSQRATDPGPVGVPVPPWRVLTAGTVVGAAMAFLVGVMFGFVDIAVIGAAAPPGSMGKTALAGLILAAWAAASVASGVVLAKYSARIRVPDWLLVACSAVGVVVFAALAAANAHDLWLVAVFVTLSGFFNSPLLIGITHMQQLVAPAGAVTGALGLVSSAIAGGVAAGLAAGGALVESVGPGYAFAGASIACLVLTELAATSRLGPQPFATDRGE